MSAALRIRILADNTVAKPALRGEHGLAIWVASAETRLLFDTGQGLVLADNALALRVDLGAVDAIILSHGHYDHTGGLAAVLRPAQRAVTVHAHPAACEPKFRREDAGVRDIGMPADSRTALRGPTSRLVLSRQSTAVAPGIHTTGEIPRVHAEEALDRTFCCDPHGRETDPLSDDQALLIETAPGTVVLLGCAHAGVINTLDHVRELTAGRPIHAVIGGLHLRSATAARLAWTLQSLRRFEIGLIAPLHCTGQKANAALWAAFPDACQPCGVGTLFEF